MVVRENERQACTYSECQHVKCNDCVTIIMSVPLSPASPAPPFGPRPHRALPPPSLPPPPEIDAAVHDTLGGGEGGY